MKNITPQQIIGHGRFSFTLLRHEEFIKYCRDRGVYIDRYQLERFEQLGVFLPLIRIKYPRLQRKIERISETSYKPLTVLEEGEEWDGETIKEYGSLYFSDTEAVEYWVKEGLITTPTKEDFQPWKTFVDEEGHRMTESFYSIFQVLPLTRIKRMFQFHELDAFFFMNDRRKVREFKKSLNYIKSRIEKFGEEENILDNYAILCHIIADRYYPFAESDSRVLVRTSMQMNPFEKEKFDFFKYCRQWKAKNVLDEISLNIDDVSSAWRFLIYEVDESSIGRWRELLDFVRREKRNQLRGENLLTVIYYIMAKMLNLFHKDLTGKNLYLPEVFTTPEEIEKWMGVTPDDFHYMEFIINEYGLNPKPQLILAVEGEGEFNEIPKLTKSLFGKSLADYRIQIINLNSVGEFVGKKSKTSDELKIERFIDHFHDAQTIVYFIIDDENNAKQAKDYLVKRKSLYWNNERVKVTVTKEDFFKVWDKNIEFDNFTDKEIAKAMTLLSENRYTFKASEIRHCRNSFGTKNLITLSELYKEKLTHGLKKTKLLANLFDYVKSKPKINISGVKKIRPIIEVIDKIISIAIKNYQPTELDRRVEAQESGWMRNNDKSPKRI